MRDNPVFSVKFPALSGFSGISKQHLLRPRHRPVLQPVVAFLAARELRQEVQEINLDVKAQWTTHLLLDPPALGSIPSIFHKNNFSGSYDVAKVN